MEKFCFKPGFYENLLCAACKSLLYPPVFQCVMGHCVCQDCSETLLNCTECKNNIMGSRNLNVEMVLATVKCRCRFDPCSQYVLLSKRLYHERICEFNPTHACLYPNCGWTGTCLVSHLIKFHKCREFQISQKKTVRGWNSKNWQNAEWGFSIWSFPKLSIINLSYSDDTFFYLWLFDTYQKRLKVKLSTGNNSVQYILQTSSVKSIERSLPFHIALNFLQDFLLQPAEGFEEGFKRLSIEIELLESDFNLD